MAYLGLVPCEHSSGASVRRGGITKAGNGAARRLLIEAAWSYRFPARLSRELLLRQENQPRPIRDIAWKGQVRLCARYRRLTRSCPRPWCRSGYPEQRWPLDQAATVGRVTMGASLRGAMVSRLM